MGYNKIIYGGVTKIDLTADTVEASSLLTGVTAHDKHGDIITGTCDYDADTSGATASASEILSGQTAFANGNELTGTMPNNGAVSGVITTKAQVYTVPQGFHDGSGTVQISPTEQAKIVSSNILEGVTILGVEGSVEPSSDIKIEASKTVTPYTTQQTILPSAGYDAMAEVVVQAIAYAETPNEYGTTITIGTVAP